MDDALMNALESYEMSVVFIVQGNSCPKEDAQKIEIGAARGHCALERQRQAGQGFRQRKGPPPERPFPVKSS